MSSLILIALLQGRLVASFVFLDCCKAISLGLGRTLAMQEGTGPFEISHIEVQSSASETNRWSFHFNTAMRCWIYHLGLLLLWAFVYPLRRWKWWIYHIRFWKKLNKIMYASLGSCKRIFFRLPYCPLQPGDRAGCAAGRAHHVRYDVVGLWCLRFRGNWRVPFCRKGKYIMMWEEGRYLQGKLTMWVPSVKWVKGAARLMKLTKIKGHPSKQWGRRGGSVEWERLEKPQRKKAGWSLERGANR